MTPLEEIARLGSVAVALLTALSAAHAAALVEVDGWRYVAVASELHVFTCERTDCIPGSRVYVVSRGSASPPSTMRKQDATAAEVAGGPSQPAKAPPGLGLDLVGGTLVIETVDDGAARFRASGIVNNVTSQFIIVSSSSDARASQANLDRFEKVLQETSK